MNPGIEITVWKAPIHPTLGTRHGELARFSQCANQRISTVIRQIFQQDPGAWGLSQKPTKLPRSHDAPVAAPGLSAPM
jgi:hypothetical protein